MITIDIEKNQGDNAKGFYGLSTDEKPIGKFREMKITNGMWFYEMDTTDIYMFDEVSSTWIKQ